MGIISCSLTVLFENPFWIGLYERHHCGKYEVCKITFGAEPKDYEVYDLMMKNWNRMRFSPAVEAEKAPSERRVNPKRVQREVHKALECAPIGTKAQQALKLQQEEGKLARKSFSKQQRIQEAERQFELKQNKRKEKHKGH